MERKVFFVVNENRIYANGCFLNIIAWKIPLEELDEIIKKYHFVFWKVYMELYEQYRREKIEDNTDTAIVCVVMKKHMKPHFIENVEFIQWDVSDLMGHIIPVYINTKGKWNNLHIEEGNMIIIVNPYIYKTNEDSENHAIDLQNSYNIINVATVAHMYKCIGINSLEDKCPYLLHVPNRGYSCSLHTGSFNSRFNSHLEKEMTKNEKNRINANYKATNYLNLRDLKLGDLKLDDLKLDDLKLEDLKLYNITRDDNPRDDNPRDDNPRNDNPRNDNPRNDNPRNDNPRDDNPRNDNPRNDNPRNDNPRNDNPRNDNPRNDNTQECSNFFHRKFSNSERKDNLSKQNNFQNNNCNYIYVDVQSKSVLHNNYNCRSTSRKIVDSISQQDILNSLHSSKEELKQSILQTPNQTNRVQESYKGINNVTNKPNETDRAQNMSSGICRPDKSSDRINGISKRLDMKRNIGESSSTKRRLSQSLFIKNEKNKSSDNINEVRKPLIKRSRIEQSLDSNKGIAQPKERKNEEKKTLYGNKEAQRTLYGNKEAQRTLYGNKEAQRTLYGNKEAQQTLYGNKEAQRTLYGNKEAQRTLYGNKEAQQTSYGQRKLSHPSDKYNKQSQERSSKLHEMEKKRRTEKYDKESFRDSYIKRKTPSSHVRSYENGKRLYDTYVRTNEKYEGTNKFINSNIDRETKTREQIFPNNKEKINKNILDNQNKTVGKKRPFDDMNDIINTCEQKKDLFSESQKVYRKNNNINQNNDKLVKHPSGKKNNINPYKNSTPLECFIERDIKICEKYSYSPGGNEHILNSSKHEQNTQIKKLKKPLHIILNEIEKAEFYGLNELYKISININSIIKNIQYYIEDLNYNRIMHICQRLSMHNFSYIGHISLMLMKKIEEIIDKKCTEIKFYSN
ncbi:nucleoporin NUP116/NSP116,putative [Plasmodium sp. DRC-Itaito]|nr:nucleoporin NUP116/NSP116,putative [Plasmodium sp. DRC-Itaito]